MKKFIFLPLLFVIQNAFAQSIVSFTTDTSLIHASYSLYVADVQTGEALVDINSGKSLTPASVLKLITSAAALELLGPNHTFTTSMGYSGTLKKQGVLEGNLVIKGGGDPAFASQHFPEYYSDFPYRWINDLLNIGVKKISGDIIVDDTYFDYLPVPSGWLWEDAGNYYGAGVYGASIYDNSYDIHFTTSAGGTKPVITGIVPEECRNDISNYLIAEGTTDKGYVFAAPYSTWSWIAGSIPVNREDFVLGASIPDPPFIFAKTMERVIREAGIEIAGKPTTARLEKLSTINNYQTISEYTSPLLHEILESLNHRSINLYAETIVKELGKKFYSKGSASEGLNVINSFLDTLGMTGLFIVDGSGLSHSNSISSKGLTDLLIHMKKNGKYFEYFESSLPDAGLEGTLKNWFKDDVFKGNLKVKSGSMTRVRSYAGYFTTKKGRQMAFTFITNDFTGPSGKIVNHYENILKEIILTH